MSVTIRNFETDYFSICILKNQYYRPKFGTRSPTPIFEEENLGIQDKNQEEGKGKSLALNFLSI